MDGGRGGGVKEHPILFSGPMVRAILEGRKTQTRRVMNPQPSWRNDVVDSSGVSGNGLWWMNRKGCGVHSQPTEAAFRECINRNGADWISPYGQRGNANREPDRLWVRETWAPLGPHAALHQATNSGHPVARWKPSIHMPRWASRLTLEVVSVRVERVQDISYDDCEKEGITREQVEAEGNCPVAAYAELWESINSKREGCAWSDNPWVWVVEFRRLP